MLLVDIGNTDVVIGYTSGQSIQSSFRFPALKHEDQGYFSFKIANELFERGISPENVSLLVISSVVPSLTPLIVKAFDRFEDTRYVEVKPGIHPELKVSIDNQNELGADIYCNALAAFLEFRTASIVVDFGTALTVTGVDSAGTIQGVAIAPGLKTAIKALFSHTAQLPEVPLSLPASALGKNTVTAIQSGVLFGYEGLVKNLVVRFKEELGENTPVYVTGGLSSIIPGIQNFTTKTDLNLTLRGLLEIGKLYT